MSDKYCKVCHSYDKEQDDEVSLKTGDIIKIIKEESEGWWEGTIISTGKTGWFPSNFVERCDAPDAKAAVSSRMSMGVAMPGLATGVNAPRLTKLTTHGVSKIFVKVEFPYEAENPDELTLKAGDTVEVTKQGDGWWDGIHNGKHGTFPSNFVRLIEDTSAAPTSPRKHPPPQGGIGAAVMEAMSLSKGADTCKVVHDYKAENCDELTLTAGDVVEIVSRDVDEGWWEGKVNGKTGVFPNNFVEVIEQQAPNKVRRPSDLGRGMLNKSVRRRQSKESTAESKPFIAGPDLLKKRPPPVADAKPFVPSMKKDAPRGISVASTLASANTAASGTSKSTQPPPPWKRAAGDKGEGTENPSVRDKPGPATATSALKVGGTGASTPASLSVAATVAATNTNSSNNTKKDTAVSPPKQGINRRLSMLNDNKSKKTTAPVPPAAAAAAASAVVVGAAASAVVVGAAASAVVVGGGGGGGGSAGSGVNGASKAEFEALKEEVKQLRQALEESRAQMKEMATELAGTKAAAGDLKAVKTTIGKTIAGFQKDIREARDERLKLSDDMKDMKLKLDFL